METVDYEPNFDESNTFTMEPTLDTVDVYVKFEDVEPILNSIQQLKTEILKLKKVYPFERGWSDGEIGGYNEAIDDVILKL